MQDAEGLNTHGIGLGLVISKKIVMEYHGQMMMHSEYKKGSQFGFILKLFDRIQIPTLYKMPTIFKQVNTFNIF